MGEEQEPRRRRLRRRARRAVDSVVDGAEAVAEPIVDRVSTVLEGARESWQERPGARVRRVRRLGSQALPYLMDIHPEARKARPVQVGLRSIDVDEIAGTAVGGGAQRGGDFLPLKQFRGTNWSGRWQRLRRASDRLETLPPIDVLKFGDRFWVVDGHNRVGLAKYNGQVGIDANITELVPSGARRSEPIVSLAPMAADSRSLRAAGAGSRASSDLAAEVPISTDGPEGIDEGSE
jgi:hypothetical protein